MGLHPRPDEGGETADRTQQGRIAEQGDKEVGHPMPQRLKGRLGQVGTVGARFTAGPRPQWNKLVGPGLGDAMDGLSYMTSQEFDESANQMPQGLDPFFQDVANRLPLVFRQF